MAPAIRRQRAIHRGGLAGQAERLERTEVDLVLVVGGRGEAEILRNGRERRPRFRETAAFIASPHPSPAPQSALTRGVHFFLVFGFVLDLASFLSFDLDATFLAGASLSLDLASLEMAISRRSPLASLGLREEAGDVAVLELQRGFSGALKHSPSRLVGPAFSALRPNASVARQAFSRPSV